MKKLSALSKKVNTYFFFKKFIFECENKTISKKNIFEKKN